MNLKNPNTLLRISAIGTAIVAACIFTPILAIVLDATGLSTLKPFLDSVLLPALVLLMCLTVYAISRMR